MRLIFLLSMLLSTSGFAGGSAQPASNDLFPLFDEWDTPKFQQQQRQQQQQRRQQEKQAAARQLPSSRAPASVEPEPLPAPNGEVSTSQ
jgi:hypothetical protein